MKKINIGLLVQNGNTGFEKLLPFSNSVKISEPLPTEDSLYGSGSLRTPVGLLSCSETIRTQWNEFYRGRGGPISFQQCRGGTSVGCRLDDGHNENVVVVRNWDGDYTAEELKSAIDRSIEYCSKDISVTSDFVKDQRIKQLLEEKKLLRDALIGCDNWLYGKVNYSESNLKEKVDNALEQTK